MSLKESINPLEYKQTSKLGKREISSLQWNATNKYRRMMELENHQWMLKLVGKNLMRNTIFTPFQRSTYKILFNYKGKTRHF